VITAWQPGGDLVVVDPPGTALRTSNRYDLLVRGGAGYGALGTFQPLTVEGLAARGDVSAGAYASSRLGFFGVTPQARSTGWTTQAVSDDRNLGANADAAELRNVLGTLIVELKRYGLLA